MAIITKKQIMQTNLKACSLWVKGLDKSTYSCLHFSYVGNETLEDVTGVSPYWGYLESPFVKHWMNWANRRLNTGRIGKEFLTAALGAGDLCGDDKDAYLREKRTELIIAYAEFLRGQLA